MVNPTVKIDDFNKSQGMFVARGDGNVDETDQLCVARDFSCPSGYVDFKSPLFQAHLAYAEFMTTAVRRESYMIPYDGGDVVSWFGDTAGCNGNEWIGAAPTVEVKIELDETTGAFLVTFGNSARYFVTPDLDLYEISVFTTDGKPTLHKVKNLPIPAIPHDKTNDFLMCATSHIDNANVEIDIFAALAKNDIAAARNLAGKNSTTPEPEPVPTVTTPAEETKKAKPKQKPKPKDDSTHVCGHSCQIHPSGSKPTTKQNDSSGSGGFNPSF